MTFSILLDDEEVAVGSQLKGSIVIETSLELMKLQSMAMIVTFKGEESTRVFHKKTKEPLSSNHELYSTSSQLRQVERKEGEKHYRVPFTISIPPSLPPSIDIPWSHIEYRVGYVLLNSEEDTTDHDTPVTLVSRHISYPVARPCYRKPFLELLKKNLFIKGNIVISARVDDTNLEPGERIEVAVSIRNHSPFKVKKMKAEIKRKVRARAGQNKRECDEILSSYEFKEYRQLKRTWKNFMKKVDYDEEFLSMEKEVDAREHVGKLRIPKNAQMSYTGTLLDIQYFVDVTIQTTLDDDIHLDITPIVVTRKQPREEEKVVEEVERTTRDSVNMSMQEDDEKVDYLLSEKQKNINRPIGKLRGSAGKKKMEKIDKEVDDEKVDNLASENQENINRAIGKLRGRVGKEKLEKIDREVEQSSIDTGKGRVNSHGGDDEAKRIKPEKQRSSNKVDEQIRRRKRKEKNRIKKTDGSIEVDDKQIVEYLSKGSINKRIEAVEDGFNKEDKKKKRRKKKRRKSTDGNINVNRKEKTTRRKSTGGNMNVDKKEKTTRRKSTGGNIDIDRNKKTKRRVSIDEILDFFEELHDDDDGSH